MTTSKAEFDVFDEEDVESAFDSSLCISRTVESGNGGISGNGSSSFSASPIYSVSVESSLSDGGDFLSFSISSTFANGNGAFGNVFSVSIDTLGIVFSVSALMTSKPSKVSLDFNDGVFFTPFLLLGGFGLEKWFKVSVSSTPKSIFSLPFPLSVAFFLPKMFLKKAPRFRRRFVSAIFVCAIKTPLSTETRYSQ